MIDRFLTYIEKEKRYSNHTITAYQNDLKQLSEYLQNNYDTEFLKDSTPSMLRSWMVQLLDEGLTPKSVNRKISTLKAFYRFCLREGLINKLPTAKLISPKISKPLPLFVREQEMNHLFEQIDFEDSFSGSRDRLLMELLYSSGMRLSELIGLELKQVGLERAQVKVLGKRNKERIIPLHKNVLSLLPPYINERASIAKASNLLITDKGEKMYPKFVYRKVNHYLSQVTSIEKKSPHVIRHTFATHMLNNGADLNTIKEILGHANLSATEVYTHNSIEKLKHIYNQAHPRA